MSGFNRDQVDELLVACHRRCCVCHRYCGVKIETDHIVPTADDGSNDIENAIPVCFDCHAEIHSYNDKHPRGRKFRPEELRGHKEQWLDICRTRPEIFTEAVRKADVGPLHALIDELEYNGAVANYARPGQLGALFLNNQFNRAIHEGAIATLKPDLKRLIIEAYVGMNRANELIEYMNDLAYGDINRSSAVTNVQAAFEGVNLKINQALSLLLNFLSSESR
jgi:hypothetical protein